MWKWLALLVALAQPAWADWRDEVIYFVMLDRFADGDLANDQGVDLADPLAFHGGDLRGLTDHLDDIQSLGATAIWLSPLPLQVGPIDHDGHPFSGHHGYWAEDMTRIDPRYGTEDDLRALTAAAHARGIKVLLDVVYNHMGYNSSLVATRPDWFRTGDACGGDDVTRCLAGLPDLRTDREDVRRYLFDAHIGLAERTGLDGFRLDTYKHVEPDFWVAQRAEVRARLGEDFFLLGEIWDGDKYAARAPFAADTLDGIFDFAFRSNTLNFLTGVSDAARYARQFAGRSDVAEGHVLAPFLSNHDVPMMLALLRGDTAKLRLAFALLMFAEGPPVIAWGEELGRAGGAWPDNRQDMPWEGGDASLQAELTDLIALRHADPDMRHGAVETLFAKGDLLALRRGGTVLIVSRSTAPQLFDFMPDGNWALLRGNLINIEGAPALTPTSYVILRQH